MPVAIFTDNTTKNYPDPVDFQYSNTTSIYLGEASPNYAFINNAPTQNQLGDIVGQATHTILRAPVVANIPAGSTVNSAILRLRTGGGGFNTFSVGARSMLRPWVLAEATWNTAFTGQLWTTPGAVGVGDSSGASEDSNILANSNTWYEWTVTNISQEVIDGIADGFLLDTSDLTGGFWFVSRENSTDGERWELVIDYTEAPSGSTGTSNTTLNATTQDSSGTIEFSGSSNTTLNATTQDASGAIEFFGSSNTTLNTATQDTSGTIEFSGSSNVTLNAVTQFATDGVATSGPKDINFSGVFSFSDINFSSTFSFSDINFSGDL